MAVNMNHEGFSRRMDVVKEVLEARGLQASKIEPVEYIENGPMPYNNFVYIVELVSPLSKGVFRASGQPFTRSPVDGVSTFNFRMSNPKADGVNNTSRVENEICAFYLRREAMSSQLKKYASIFPTVYASWTS